MMSTATFEFRIRDCEDSTFRALRTLNHQSLGTLRRKLRATEHIDFTEEDFKLSAFTLGFNQFPRDQIDYELGEFMQDQVSTFRVGYITDDYYYGQYSKTNKAVMLRK